MTKSKKKSSEDRLDRVERILAEMVRDRKRAAADSEARWKKMEKSIAEADERFGGFTQIEGELLEAEFANAMNESMIEFAYV